MYNFISAAFAEHLQYSHRTVFDVDMIFMYQVMSCLLEYGWDVLLSDIDSVWLKDPIKDLSQIEGDIVASRVSWPARFGDPTFRVTASMGFILFRAGGKGMGEFQRVMNEFMTKKCDQVSALLDLYIGVTTRRT